VVDDVGVGEALAVLGLGATEDAEEIVGVAGPLGRKLGPEVLLAQPPALQATVRLAARDVGPDDRLPAVDDVAFSKLLKHGGDLITVLPQIAVLLAFALAAIALAVWQLRRTLAARSGVRMHAIRHRSLRLPGGTADHPAAG
jgi:hypothetical protein